MRLCIYGSLDIGLSFGGKLTRKFPEEQPDFAVHCKPAARTGTSTSKQYITYTDTEFSLAIGLCTWLSYRSENFSRIETFSVQCFAKNLDEQNLENFKYSLLLALSPDSVLEVREEVMSGL
jgi:hypothetical protein